MLPKNQRIQRKMFGLFDGRSKVFRSSLFLLKIAPSNHYQFCFSVSKKIAKDAVVRNRLRRFGYHSLKKYLNRIKQNNLYLFIFKRVAKDLKEVDNNLYNILTESKIIQ